MKKTGINWGVRFNKENLTFILRFIFALAVPVLAYLNVEAKDITTWDFALELFKQFISNPFLVILTITNALNMVPDPTTKGIADSEKAMTYDTPGNIGGGNV